MSHALLHSFARARRGVVLLALLFASYGSWAGSTAVEPPALPAPAALQPLVVSYVWTGLGTTANWTNALNWTPVRALPQPDDALLFDGAVTSAPNVNLDFVAETIGQLLFVNNVRATFGTTAGDRTLTINNLAAGADLGIAAGSTLTVNNPTPNVGGLKMQLGTGATGAVAGKLVFAAGFPTVGPHQLLGSGPGSIVFGSGSVFTAQDNFTGNPFGAATANNGAVIFRNGSRYEQFGGSNPFALSQPAAVAVFEPTSYFYFAETGNLSPTLSGRTYGHLELNATGTSSLTGGSAATIFGDLVVTSGNVNANLTGGLNLKGNLLVNGGTLTFNPSTTSAGTLTFNGPAAQLIGGTGGTLAFGPGSSVVINNAVGVSLKRPVRLQSGLALTAGLLTTDAANLLTLAVGVTVNGASSTSFVNGPLARETGPGPATAVFPIGKGTAYRPLTLNATSQTAAATYTAEQFEPNPSRNLDPDNGLGNAPLKRVSSKRFFTVNTSNAGSGFAGSITLSFGSDDYVNSPSKPELVIAKRDGGAAGLWTNIDRAPAPANTGGADTGAGGAAVSGTLTSAQFSGFSDFTLGATNDLSMGNIFNASNPLPVELTFFSAQRQGGNAVAVKWSTASEKNSARFEVQRSPNGRDFVTVAEVAAQGNSTQPTAYASVDQAAPAVALYYRLRQVDLDGAVVFSPPVGVTGLGRTAKVLLYPNPVQDRISFVADAATPYRVLNQLGQILRQGTTEPGAATVLVATLPTGLYLLELQTPAGRVVQKFEKQ